MALTEALSPVSTVVRTLFALVGRRGSHPRKDLQAKLLLRGIVAELPDDLPFHIHDEEGKRHKGVYAIGVMLWNRGDQPVTDADFTEAAPFKLTIAGDATLVGARVVKWEEETECALIIIDDQNLSVKFDCINPGEYLLIPIFVTGNANTEVKISGRIIGQETPIDQTADEVTASLGERIISAILLLLLLNAIPGILVGGWYILRDYGLDALIHSPETIPRYLQIPFFSALMINSMIIISRFGNFLERRKYPKGYPLYADLEPPLLNNLKGLFLTTFKGKKQRVSVSLFNWGEPILMPEKKVKRRTVDDWIQ